MFVLGDVFGIGFDEIATMVGRTPAACRQLAVRARARIERDGVGRFEPDRNEQRRVVESFANACASRLLHGAFSGRGAQFTVELVNGEPGILVVLGARTVAVIAVGVCDGRVRHVDGVANPAKLPPR